MKIEVEVVGSFCNTWPNLIIEINNEVIFDGLVEGKKHLALEFEELIEKNNVLVIGMNNKSFGQNKIWDTKTKQNVILEDKTIRVLSLKLNGVECRDLFGNKFYVKRTHKQPSYFPDVVDSVDTMNYNGYFTFSFDMPLYNSIINKKFKKDGGPTNASYFSNYTKVFHYEDEKKIIKDIYKILDRIDEKFSNKRTKIRNS
jgi:hypothetical protein